MAGSLTPAQAAAAMAAAQAAQREFVVEAFTLLTFATLFVILRTVSRWWTVGFRQFQLDDYLMWFAITLYGIETGAAYMVGDWFHGLANNGMTTQQRIALQPGSPEFVMRVHGSKIQIIGWNIYTLLLWTLKMCMCVFYARLTAGLSDYMKVRIRTGYVLIVVTYLSCVMAILLACHPLAKNWQIYPDPGNYCQPAISKVNCLVIVCLNVATDLYLMSIPLPLMFAARMTIRRKLLFTFMFGGGFFVIACGILRCALILLDPIDGAQQAGSWAVRETFVSVIIGNLPMVYQLFRRGAIRAVDQIKTRSSHMELSDGSRAAADRPGHNPPSYRTGGFRSAESSRTGKKSRFLHPLSMRNVTMSESQEELHMNDIKANGCVVINEFTIEEREVPSAAHTAPPSGSTSPKGGDFIYSGPAHKKDQFTAAIEERDEDSA